MTTRIEDIILRARDILADPNAERWSDDRLIRLIDEGQRDIAHFTRILRGETSIPLILGQATYTLPDDVFLITRAAFNECQITPVTYDKMDELATIEATSDYQDTERRRGYAYSYNDRPLCWETAEGSDVEHIIYDKRDMSEIRVYPIPSDGIIDVQYTFYTTGSMLPFDGGVMTDLAGFNFTSPFGTVVMLEGEVCNDVTIEVADPNFGVVVDMDTYTFDSVYGLVVETFDPRILQEVYEGEWPYGVTVDAFEHNANLRLWYVRTPKTVTAIDSELEIPRHFDVALKHYAVWHSFRDDYDTRNQEKAGGAAALYERELNLVKEVESKNGVRAPQRRTTYRGAFN